MSAIGWNAQTVDRPRLTARFTAGFSRRLTLVEAPLGYGKTTLISIWLRQLQKDQHVVATVSLEGVARHKFERIAEALSNLGLHYDEALGLSLLPDAQPPPGPRFLVLDDFHDADDASRAFVQDVLRGNAHGLHILIGTREPPGFPLTKLRMADEVNDFNIEDLRFDLAEAQALFQEDLPAKELQSYVDRAEGWVGALQLLRQFGLKQDGPPPNFDQLTQFGDYLNEQYFEQLSEAQQFMLLHSAHVDRIDGDLLNWLTDRKDGWPQLAQLSSANALIFEETQSEKTSYRYHPLIRDYLRRKQQHLGENRLAELHQATSEWFAERDSLFEAMHHARLAGETDRAKTLLLQAGGVQYGMLHGAGRLAACLEVLKPEQIQSSRRLLLVRAYVLLKTGRIREAIDILKDVRTRTRPGEEEIEREVVLMEAHARIYADTPMSPKRLEALEYAIRSAPPNDPLTRGMLSNFLCMFLIEFGEFEKARLFGDQAMALYRDIGATHLQFFMHLHLSAIDLEIDSLAPAKAARRTAVEICQTEFPTDPSLRAIAEIYYGEAEFEAGEIDGLAERLRGSLLRIDRMEGWNMLYLAGYETCLGLLVENEAFDAAVELIEHAGNLVNRRGMALFSNQLLAMQLDLAVRAGARKEARRLAGELNILLSDRSAERGLRWRGRVRAELAMARFEAETGAQKAALDRLFRVIRFCRAEGLIRLEMRALVRRVCLEAKLENASGCYDALLAYLEYARRHGSFGAVLRDGAAFREAALWLVMSQGLGRFEPEDIRMLASSLWKAAGRDVASPSNILEELLTEKEIGVLSQLAKGSANKVIARSLQVTEPTVKFHLQNIYRKLGVNSRKLAAAIALQYGGPQNEDRLSK